MKALGVLESKWDPIRKRRLLEQQEVLRLRRLGNNARILWCIKPYRVRDEGAGEIDRGKKTCVLRIPVSALLAIAAGRGDFDSRNRRL